MPEVVTDEVQVLTKEDNAPYYKFLSMWQCPQCTSLYDAPKFDSEKNLKCKKCKWTGIME